MNALTQAAPAMHLFAMGCPLSDLGREGTLSWGGVPDLFGDVHVISVSWTPRSWKAERQFAAKGKDPLVSWCFEARAGEGGRFRLQPPSGEVIAALREEGRCPASIALACRFIRAELQALNPVPAMRPRALR
jgi:hypothetical protein